MDPRRARSHVSLEDEEDAMDDGASPLPVQAYLERRDVETAAGAGKEGAATADPATAAPRAGDAASANGNENASHGRHKGNGEGNEESKKELSGTENGEKTQNRGASASSPPADLAGPTTTAAISSLRTDAGAEALDPRTSVLAGPAVFSSQPPTQPPTQPAAYAPYPSGPYGWTEPPRDVKGPPAYDEADAFAQSYGSTTQLARPTEPAGMEMTVLGAGAAPVVAADARRPSSSLQPTYQPTAQPVNGFPGEYQPHRNSLAWVVNPLQTGAGTGQRPSTASNYDGTMAAKPAPPPFEAYAYGGGPRASYDSNADRGLWAPPPPPMDPMSASQSEMLGAPPVPPPPPAEDLVPAVSTRQWYDETPNRHAFIRKVYLILLVQLSLTVAWCAICLFVPSVQSWVQTEYGMMVAVMVLSFVILIVLFCVRTIVPWNYICLFIFTLMMSYSIGVIVSYYDSLVVLQAVLVTAGIFVCLTAFTLQSRYDFSSWGPYLFVFLLCFILSGIVYAFLPFNTVAEYFYCSLGALLFSLYIIFDTYMIVNRLSQEEYILGAIDLYVDILNLFLMILRIFGAANN